MDKYVSWKKSYKEKKDQRVTISQTVRTIFKLNEQVSQINEKVNSITFPQNKENKKLIRKMKRLKNTSKEVYGQINSPNFILSNIEHITNNTLKKLFI